MSNRAVVHLGPIKSGTSALARYLTAITARGLVPPGILYPTGELWFGSSGNIVKHRLELEMLMPGAAVAAKSAKTDLTRRAISEVANIQRRQQDSTAIFIVETGLARLDPTSLAQVFSEHFDETVFVAMARRQDKAVASIISQRAKMWGNATNLSPQAHIKNGDIDIDWLAFDRVLQKWTVPLAKSRFMLIPYLEGEQGTFGMIERFFGALELPKPPRTIGIEGRRIHPTFSQAGLESMVRIKRRNSQFGWIPGVQSRLKERFEATVAVHHAAALKSGLEPSGLEFRPWSLNATDTTWVLDYFRESNQVMLAEVNRAGLELDWSEWENSLAEASQ